MNIFDLITMPTEGDLPPPEVPYYIAAQQGLYIHKKGPLGTALLPTKDLPKTLPAMNKDWENGRFTYGLDNLPASLIATAVAFFRVVFDKHSAEAEVIILFNDKLAGDARFDLYCPFQRVSGASVHSLYDPTTLPAGFQAIGSIHSHCNMDAFHSGTDTTDASSFPGLHLTVGHISAATPAFAAMVMFNGIRFDYEPEKVADIAHPDGGTLPDFWPERVVTESERERANVLADQIKNVSQADLDKFLGRHVWSGPASRPGLHSEFMGGWNYEMWDGESRSWNHWSQKQPKQPKEPKTTGRARRKGKLGPEPQTRWSSELRTNLPPQLLDRLGEFVDIDAAIEGMEIVIQRLRGTAGNWDLTFGYEISDTISGQTILWDFGDDDEDLPLLPETTATPPATE